MDVEDLAGDEDGDGGIGDVKRVSRYVLSFNSIIFTELMIRQF